jgi:hypothetical protein
MNLRNISLLACLLFFLKVNGQDLPPEKEQQLERLAEVSAERSVEDNNEGEAIRDESLKMDIAELLATKIDLNETGAEGLRALGLLTEVQISGFLEYRKIFGKLVDLNELQAVSFFDLPLIGRLLPFIRLGPAVSLENEIRDRLTGDHTFVIRAGTSLVSRKGYDPVSSDPFLGGRTGYGIRYSFRSGKGLQYGFLGDQDAGEPWRKKGVPGFDFYSAHLFIKDLRRFKAIVVGDFIVNFGQGLIRWQGLAFGKGPDVTQIMRNGPALLPYRSSGSFNFNRGLGFTVRRGAVETTVFGSWRKKDARLLPEEGKFSSWVTSGLHRNGSEIRTREQVCDLEAGISVQYSRDVLRVGANWTAHRLSHEMEKPPEPYNLYAFSGNRLMNASLNYSVTFRNMNSFGEMAVDDRKNAAFLAGMLVSLHPDVDLALLYRNYSRGYRTIAADAFGESSQTVNEEGLYVGISARPCSGLQWSGFVDMYRFPWLRYRLSAPANGFEMLSQLSYQPSKKTSLLLRYRYERKPLNSGVYEYASWPADVVRQSWRLHLESRLAADLIWKGRVEATRYFQEGNVDQAGFLAYSEMAFKMMKNWNVHLRAQYFETGGYESRIYAYEDGLLYSSEMPASAGKGYRYYATVECRPMKKLLAGIRLSVTSFEGAQERGTGLDGWSGRLLPEIKGQIVFWK